MQHFTTSFCSMKQVKQTVKNSNNLPSSQWWQTQSFTNNDQVVDSRTYSLFCLHQFLYSCKNNRTHCSTLGVVLEHRAHREITTSRGFYALLTTYWDRPYYRFRFHYLIKSVQQLADSSGCQPGFKAGLWALYEAAGCQLAQGHRRQCWLGGTWVCIKGVQHSLSSWCCIIDLFSDHMQVRVSEKKRDRGDAFFKRRNILCRLKSLDQFSLSPLTEGSLDNVLLCVLRNTYAVLVN